MKTYYRTVSKSDCLARRGARRSSVVGIALSVLVALAQTACKQVSADAPIINDQYANLELSTLVTGTDPVSGVQGEKKILVARSGSEFATLWSGYSSEQPPSVDFTKNAVVIFDRGMMDINLCSTAAIEESVVATRHVSANIVRVNRFYRQSCPNPDKFCAAVVQMGRPFTIVGVPAIGNDQLFVSESVAVENCT